jgi:hypothetical protein
LTDRSLSEALVFVAADLDKRRYPFAGVVRRAARAVAELQVQPSDASTRSCPMCGAEVARGDRGRPRIYCGRSCRNAARYRAKL